MIERVLQRVARLVSLEPEIACLPAAMVPVSERHVTDRAREAKIRVPGGAVG